MAKVNPDGSSLIYATFLGGDSEDRSQGVDVDAFGNAHVVGVTLSTDFPIANAFQPLRNGADRNLFITKFNSDGTEFIYSTYFGGTGADAYEDSDIVVDSCGKAFVTMETSSVDLLSINEIQPGFAGGGYDAFVANLNASGTQLLHSTYLGGSETDYGYGISLDAVGNIYVAGATNSPDFPTVNAQPVIGSGFDAFVSKIDFDSTRVTPDNRGQYWVCFCLALWMRV